MRSQLDIEDSPVSLQSYSIQDRIEQPPSLLLTPEFLAIRAAHRENFAQS